MAEKKSEFAKAVSRAMKARWASIPKKDRAQFVPKTGGRPRKYPPCPKYPGHVFSPKTGKCPCGYKPRTKTPTKKEKN